MAAWPREIAETSSFARPAQVDNKRPSCKDHPACLYGEVRVDEAQRCLRFELPDLKKHGELKEKSDPMKS